MTSVGRDGERKEAQGRRGEKEETGRGRQETVCKTITCLSLKPKMFILLVKHISSTYLTHRPKIFILLILRPIISKYNVAGR